MRGIFIGISSLAKVNFCDFSDVSNLLSWKSWFRQLIPTSEFKNLYLKRYIVLHCNEIPDPSAIFGVFLCYNTIIMKLTPTIIIKIVTAVELTDIPLYRLAEHCEITYQTLRNWLRNGEKYKQQLDEGKIQESDLNTKQQRELDLFVRVEVARSKLVSDPTLKHIRAYAVEKLDTRDLIGRLKRMNKDYRVDY